MSASSIPQIYTLGRGELYFARYVPGTLEHDGNYRYLGNSPEFNLTVEEEKLDHFSSDRGIREKDLSISLEVTRSATITLDSIELDNLALFFFGSSTLAQVSKQTGVEETYMTQGNAFIQLGEGSDNPVGYRHIDYDTIVVTDGESSAKTYVKGTDYTVEVETGLLYIVPGEGIDTDAAGDTQKIEVTYDVKKHEYDRVISGGTAIEGALKYVSRNPAGEQRDFFMPRVTVGPNGDLALKGDDWQTMPFSIEVLKKPGYEALYATGRGVLTT